MVSTKPLSMARGIILLLLVVPLAVATTLSSPSTRFKGSFVGERSNSIPSSMAALDFSSSSVEPKLQQGEKPFTPEAYQVTWNLLDQQSHGEIVAHKSSFTPEAYAVTWGPPDQQTHGDVAAHQSSFTPEAYAVNWGPPDHESHGDVATHQSSFTPEAYQVTWNPPPSDQQAHGVARQTTFEPETYPVKWKQSNQQLQHDVARQSSFTPDAYAVNWSPPDQRSHGDVARQESFEPEKPAQAPDAAEATPARGHGRLHVEPGMLFTRKSLLPGTVLPEGTKFGGGDGFPDPQRFVLRADADAIPFSYNQLDTILRMFRIPRGSKKAEQVAATLRTCEAVDSPDPHTCATSEQAATDFAAASLGVRPRELVAVVTVVHGSKDAARYVVAPDGVARIGKAGAAAAAAVPCHPMAYPYMVHYCHRPADVEALRVELTGLGGGAAATTAIAMCHANTTSWDGRYFEMLNATRGEEICHFMPRNYVLWLPAADL